MPAMPNRTPVAKKPGVYSYPTRRGTRYVAVAMHDGKQTWLSGFTTARLADEWREAEVVSMRQGRSGKAPARMTLTEFIEKRWWPDVLAELAAPSIAAYSSHRKHIEERLGDKRLRDLDALDVQAFKTGMTVAGVGQSMRAATFKRLRQILNHATALGLITLNPCSTINAPQEPEHRAPLLTLDTVQHLLRIAEEDTRYGALFTVVVFAGLRWSELKRMEWSQINWTEGKLDIDEGKTRTSEAPMWFGERTLARLYEHRQQQMAWAFELGGAPPALVFTDDAGQALDYWQFTRGVWYPVREKLGLPKMHFHDLRHVHATLLGQAKVHPFVAQRRMRHADVRTTMLYTDTADEAQKAAASAVEALLDSVNSARN